MTIEAGIDREPGNDTALASREWDGSGWTEEGPVTENEDWDSLLAGSGDVALAMDDRARYQLSPLAIVTWIPALGVVAMLFAILPNIVAVFIAIVFGIAAVNFGIRGAQNPVTHTPMGAYSPIVGTGLGILAIITASILGSFVVVGLIPA